MSPFCSSFSHSSGGDLDYSSWDMPAAFSPSPHNTEDTGRSLSGGGRWPAHCSQTAVPPWEGSLALLPGAAQSSRLTQNVLECAEILRQAETLLLHIRCEEWPVCSPGDLLCCLLEAWGWWQWRRPN